jgi:hypothetical protein
MSYVRMLLAVGLVPLLLWTAGPLRADTSPPPPPLSPPSLWTTPPAAPAAAPHPRIEDVRQAASRRPSYARYERFRDWRFRFSLPLWIPGITGEFAGGDSEVASDPPNLDDFFESVINLKFAFVGQLQYQTGPWELNVDGFGASIGQTMTLIEPLPLPMRRPIETTIKGLTVRGYAGYRFADTPIRLGGRRPSRLRAMVCAGARFYRFGLKVDQPRIARLDQTADWVDPIVGLAATWDISRRWQLHVEGDVGGFGVGSEFAWWLGVEAGYRFSRLFGVRIGYSWLDFDYRWSIRGVPYGWDLQLRGPKLALSFSF